jgi:hypothetical protein
MADLNDILQTGDELDREDLLKYLQGNASDEERFAVERQMAESDFVGDAVEGLQQFGNQQEMRKYVDDLNRQLQKYTSARSARKNKRRLKDNNWLIIAILGILLICVAGYLLIHFNTKH